MGQEAVLTPRPWREGWLSPRTLPRGPLCPRHLCDRAGRLIHYSGRSKERDSVVTEGSRE